MNEEDTLDVVNWTPSISEVEDALAKVITYIRYYVSPEFLGKFDLVVREDSPTKKVFCHYPLLPGVTREDLLCMNAVVMLECREYGLEDLAMYVVKNSETGLYGHALEVTLEKPIDPWFTKRSKEEVN